MNYALQYCGIYFGQYIVRSAQMQLFRSFSNAKKVEHFMWCQSNYGEQKVYLADGKLMPIIGLGTWLISKNKVAESVKTAIDAGYRLIDCAYVNNNETDIGEGIEAKIKEGIVKREDLFITSKLWNTFHRPDLVQTALENTLASLKLKYLDLYLIHWPTGYKEGCDLFPIGKDGKIVFSSVDYVDTWKALEKCVEAGLTKSIGISNFNRRQTERITKVAKIHPVTNQIECHPYLTQRKLADFCKSKEICITAYSPLGSPKRPWANEGDKKILEEAKIQKVAKKKKKTPAQILIRYQIQRGHVVIPKSENEKHIKSNIKVFDFELTADEIKNIESFECNGRLIPLLNEAGSHKYYPFHDEY